jgi:8-amino-7-oxononanoate synthase
VSIVILGWPPEIIKSLYKNQAMIDFTSSLYLGMKHSSAELSGWQQLTTGVPAALYEFSRSKQISKQIAQMQGLETGISAPSTLHLYWDLFGFLSAQQIVVFIDEKIYPVSKYGIERLIVKKIPVYFFRHLDAHHFSQLIESKLQKFKIPIVFTDGWCPQCGKPAPIKNYSQILKPFGGKIIIDDTQAFGIFGERVSEIIYGSGGGGILKWLNIHDNNIITIVSLAKAFGVPMAVISGNKTFISAFEQSSETRANSSPVSMAHLNAGLNALKINQNSGDQRREKLLHNVLLIRKELKKSGINLDGGIFPVQSISNMPPQKLFNLFEKLNGNGIRTVLVSTHIQHHPAISLIIRYDHLEEEIKRLTHSFKTTFSMQ